MKSTKLLLTLLLVVVIGGMIVTIVTGSQKNKQSTAAATPIPSSVPVIVSHNILFYGSTCPHCQEVEQWLIEHSIDDSKVFKKEVYANRANAQELAQAALVCGLPTDSIGVPFLVTPNQSCIIGTSEIIAYLTSTYLSPSATSAAEKK